MFHNTLHFCEFCNTSGTLQRLPSCSVTDPIPYRDYPYPTEPNLANSYVQFYKTMKNIGCEYDRWMVETQLCKLRDTSGTIIGRACAIPGIPFCEVTLGVIPVYLRKLACDACSRCHSLVWLCRDWIQQLYYFLSRQRLNPGLVPRPGTTGFPSKIRLPSNTNTILIPVPRQLPAFQGCSKQQRYTRPL